jgi:hypothetical protein
LIKRWIGFWDQREAPHSLALVRILVGSALLFDLLEAGWYGVIDLLWAPPPVGSATGQLADHVPIAVRLLGPSPETGFVLWLLAVACCVLFVLGAAYRIASIGLVFAMVELTDCQPVGDGSDALLTIVLPLLALSGAGAVWSVDAWFRQWRGKARTVEVTAWPRYLLFLQLVWLYLSAVSQRNLQSWGPQNGFSAIGDVLGDPHFARFAPGSLALFEPLLRVATLVTMLFELSAPLVLLWTWYELRPTRGGRFGDFVRRWRVRWIWLAVGVSLHSGIALTMNLGMFPFVMLALYPAFVHPSELLRGVEAVKRRLSKLCAGEGGVARARTFP